MKKLLLSLVSLVLLSQGLNAMTAKAPWERVSTVKMGQSLGDIAKGTAADISQTATDIQAKTVPDICLALVLDISNDIRDAIVLAYKIPAIGNTVGNALAKVFHSPLSKIETAVRTGKVADLIEQVHLILENVSKKLDTINNKTAKQIASLLAKADKKLSSCSKVAIAQKELEAALADLENVQLDVAADVGLTEEESAN